MRFNEFTKQSVAEGVTEMVGYNQGKSAAMGFTGRKPVPKKNPNPFDRSAEDKKSQLQRMKDAGKKNWYAIEGMLDNPGAQDSPVASAIIRRILLQRTDLLAKYGPEKVGMAVDEVADFVGDVDEIGSSDVSGWIRHVEQMLGNMSEQGVAEGGYPEVDHMNGPRGINLPSADTRDILQKTFEIYGNYEKWERDVNHVNSELLDDNAEYSTMSGGKIISINGKDFAFWSNRNGNGSIDIRIAKKHSGQGVAEAGSGRDSWDSNMPGYQGDYGGAENWGRRSREDDEHHEIDRKREEQLAQYNQTGKFWLKYKDSQKHVSAEHFIGKAAATAAAQQMIRAKPEVKGNLLITAHGPNGE